MALASSGRTAAGPTLQTGLWASLTTGVTGRPTVTVSRTGPMKTAPASAQHLMSWALLTLVHLKPGLMKRAVAQPLTTSAATMQRGCTRSGTMTTQLLSILTIVVMRAQPAVIPPMLVQGSAQHVQPVAWLIRAHPAALSAAQANMILVRRQIRAVLMIRRGDS
eukprot:COSAG02_NODE_29391_length_570_cov_0.847134_1_plen_164_part_00